MKQQADIRKLYRVCHRRLQAADLLLRHGFHLEAVYVEHIEAKEFLAAARQIQGWSEEN